MEKINLNLFQEVANLVTKGDGKIDEQDAKKANDLGLAFVLAGMSEEEFNKAAEENQNQVTSYMEYKNIQKELDEELQKSTEILEFEQKTIEIKFDIKKLEIDEKRLRQVKSDLLLSKQFATSEEDKQKIDDKINQIDAQLQNLKYDKEYLEIKLEVEEECFRNGEKLTDEEKETKIQIQLEMRRAAAIVREESRTAIKKYGLE